ncbi:hypothetical protein [Methylobacterium sp. Leaf89]|uniref:hypothetical protein n=1 Tax=Methylobacterium sp. Leaf89 TaxID=1736245 RepID=UPI0012E81DB9|nr:hypothetical protein [Methylobacterium sp. Leaf89]
MLALINPLRRKVMISSVNPSIGQIYNLAEMAPAITKMPESRRKEREAELNPPPPPAPGNVVADNDPSNQYATLEKNGRVLATVYKSGLISTPNEVQLPSDLANDGHGTSLADARLKQMLDMYGGEIKYTQDTMMQAASKTASTLFSAHLAGQT